MKITLAKYVMLFCVALSAKPFVCNPVENIVFWLCQRIAYDRSLNPEPERRSYRHQHVTRNRPIYLFLPFSIFLLFLSTIQMKTRTPKHMHIGSTRERIKWKKLNERERKQERMTERDKTKHSHTHTTNSRAHSTNLCKYNGKTNIATNRSECENFQLNQIQ